MYMRLTQVCSVAAAATYPPLAAVSWNDFRGTSAYRQQEIACGKTLRPHFSQTFPAATDPTMRGWSLGK